MDNILKKLREESGMTQETVAYELGVTVNTIQNWERTGKITKESLHGLLDLYGVDQMMRNRVVLSIFGDNCTEEKSVGVDNFPYLRKDQTFRQQQEEQFFLLMRWNYLAILII